MVRTLTSFYSNSKAWGWGSCGVFLFLFYPCNKFKNVRSVYSNKNSTKPKTNIYILYLSNTQKYICMYTSPCRFYILILMNAYPMSFQNVCQSNFSIIQAKNSRSIYAHSIVIGWHFTYYPPPTPVFLFIHFYLFIYFYFFYLSVCKFLECSFDYIYICMVSVCSKYFI